MNKEATPTKDQQQLILSTFYSHVDALFEVGMVEVEDGEHDLQLGAVFKVQVKDNKVVGFWGTTIRCEPQEEE